MTSIRYTVHSVAQSEISVDATVAGQVVTAKVPATVVEMISEDGSMGHTFRFTGDASEFVEGQAVDVTFTVAA